MKFYKKICLTVLVACGFVLAHDGYIFLAKKKLKASIVNNIFRETTGTDSGLLIRGEKFYPDAIKKRVTLLSSGCSWNITTSTISTPGAYPAECHGTDLMYTFAATCGSGTGLGCLPLYVNYVYTTLDSNCSETVWSYSVCSTLYPGGGCGNDPHQTANMCMTIARSIYGPPWGKGVLRVYVYDNSNCDSFSTALHVEKAYINVTGNPLTGPTFNVISNPCP